MPEAGTNGENDGSRGRVSTTLFVALAASGILIVAFAVAILRKGDDAREPRLGGPAALSPGGDATTPAPLSPFGTIPHGPMTLRWRKASGIEEYEAHLTNNLGKTFWRSPRVRGDSVEVPAEVAAQLVPGPAFFWRVIGYAPDGHEEPSGTVQFFVSP